MVALLPTTKSRSPITAPIVDARILTFRGYRVMLDSDLAILNGVPTKSLNLAVRRNSERFPVDFMFQVTAQEFSNVKFQNEISKSGGRGRRRFLPHVFTPEGVAMLSSVLRSSRAVAANIEIMRAFVRMRRLAFSVTALDEKIDALEQKCDGQFGLVFKAIKELMARSAADETGAMGFHGRSQKPTSP